MKIIMVAIIQNETPFFAASDEHKLLRFSYNKASSYYKHYLEACSVAVKRGMVNGKSFPDVRDPKMQCEWGPARQNAYPE